MAGEAVNNTPNSERRELDLEALNLRFEREQPAQILRWVWAEFGPKAAATSSFQTQSVPLLHLISRHAPRLTVLFLDTGFHFPETLAFRDTLERDFHLQIRALQNQLGHEAFDRQYGQLYRRDPDMCCYLNKVEPLDAGLAEYDAWITGVRRDQTPSRRNTPIIEHLDDGTYKICPMVNWTEQDVSQYIARHQLPAHPLTAQGYPSIGCAPCTKRPRAGEDARSGRWAGSEKTECGLHTKLGKASEGSVDSIQLNFGEDDE